MITSIVHPAYKGRELTFDPALEYHATRNWLRGKFRYIDDQDFDDRYHDTWVRYLTYTPKDGVLPLSIFARMFATAYSSKDRREPLDDSEGYERENEDGEVYHIEHDELTTQHCTDALDLLRLVNKIQLSDLQTAVLRGTLEGYTDQQIADQLNVGRTRVNGIYNYQLLKKLKEITNS